MRKYKIKKMNDAKKINYSNDSSCENMNLELIKFKQKYTIETENLFSKKNNLEFEILIKLNKKNEITWDFSKKDESKINLHLFLSKNKIKKEISSLLKEDLNINKYINIKNDLEKHLKGMDLEKENLEKSSLYISFFEYNNFNLKVDLLSINEKYVLEIDNKKYILNERNMSKDENNYDNCKSRRMKLKLMKKDEYENYISKRLGSVFLKLALI